MFVIHLYGQFHVVGLYNTCHTFCTAIADLYSVSIKDFTEFVDFGEMVVKQVKETFCGISGNSSTERGIEPDDVSVSVSSTFSFFVLVVIQFY